MSTAEQIAAQYDLTRSGESYTGECPCCGYRGFNVTERGGRVLIYCHGGGCSQSEIIEVLSDADLWGPSFDELPLERLESEQACRRSSGSKDESQRAALAIWQRSQPAAGTIIERYLRARGYRGAVPLSLRFARGKQPSSDTAQPMMVAAVVRPDRPLKIIGIHRTFLLHDGSAKANLEPNKMSLGSVRGGAVPLAPPGSKIAVSEGIETGLSFMQATGIPTWAALSAGGITNLVLPDGAREVLIAADADQVGLEAAETAAGRWHAQGRTVRIVKPPAGLDFNDLAREQ